MRLLVTGGCGFIGSNFVRRRLIGYPDDVIVNVDKLTYAGRGRNLTEFEADPRYRLIVMDIADRSGLEEAMAGADAVVNFAAESHVDRSIIDADAFLRTNVGGLHALLQVVRDLRIPRFIHVSTDEVYGSLQAGSAAEDAPLLPNSPYAASKAAGDLLARAFAQTHGVPAIIVRPSNNFGPYQFPEKLIPLCITNLLEEKTVPLYGDGQNVRDWLHVDDCCDALDVILARGEAAAIYNVSAGNERENLAVVREILTLMRAGEEAIEWVPDRPGHDRRYSTRSDRVRALGWEPRIAFTEGLRTTVEWYRAHQAWWRPLRDRVFEDYYRRQYVHG